MLKVPLRRRKIKKMMVPYVTWLAFNIEQHPISDVFAWFGINSWRWGIEIVILNVGLSCFLSSDYDRDK